MDLLRYTLRVARRIPLRYLLCLGAVALVAVAMVQFSLPANTERVQAAAPVPTETTILGVGDILLGRQLGEDMAKTGDYTLAFRDIRETLAAADITFGNLEGPFCGKPPYPASGMSFRFRPEAIASLMNAGFDVVSVANNHFGDGGDACMTFSVDLLRDSEVEPAGAGRTFEEAHQAVVVERNGIGFAFLGYTFAARNDDPKSKRPVIAGRDAEQVRRDVVAARERADLVIVSLHDGAEYTERVAPETEEFAHAAIDAGAVAVFGHHPHVPQRVERYKNGWIFYSLGNFVFQQNTPPATRRALVARLTFSGGELVIVEAIPVVIEWFAQPRLASAEEGPAILASVGLKDSLLWPAAAPAEKQPAGEAPPGEKSKPAGSASRWSF